MELASAVTAQRAARLYRFLMLVADVPKTRTALLKRLKVDRRGFYRDLELVRSLGVDVASDGENYHLVGSLDESLEKLPFPDPGLSFRDVLLLAQGGRSAAHRKLQLKINTFTGNHSK